MMKRLCGFVLMACVIIEIVLFSVLGEEKVYAKTNHTQAEAIEWIQARENESWAKDYDGTGGLPQCVDLIVYYWEWLAGYRSSGNGYDYMNISLPSGWSFTATPQPGDIAVWDKYHGFALGYGHVALVKSVNGNTFSYVDVNGANGTGGKGSISISNASKFIHPDFSGTANVSVTFNYWEDSNYTYIKEKEAAIGQEIIVYGASGGENGILLYDENNQLLAKAQNDTLPNGGRVYFVIKKGGECDYDLQPRTTYTYRFYVKVGTETYIGKPYFFQTEGDSLLSIRGIIDDKEKDDISGFGTFDVYLNGKLAAQNVTQFVRRVPIGTTYSIENVKVAYGKAYGGIDGGYRTGTFDSFLLPNADVRLRFVTIPQDMGVDTISRKWKGNTYVLVPRRSSWYAAKYYSQKLGGHLLTVNSKEEQDAILSFITDLGGPWWTGGTYESSEGEWHWVTGEPFSFTRWEEGEPDFENEDGSQICVVLSRKDYWFDSNGSSLRYFICEIENPNPLNIISEPADTTVTIGSTASFVVKAIGEGLTYQWQYKSAGTSNWYNYSGMTSAELNVPYLESRNGMSFRCKVTDTYGNAVWSNAGVLCYKTPIIITSQPSSITVITGEVGNLAVRATGSNLTYLWQYKAATNTLWTDWTTKTTASISIAYADYRNNMSFRCVITDEQGNKAYSDSAVLTYKNVVKITTQPENTTVNAGELAYFTVKATGKSLKYLWQYKEKGKSTWTDWTSKTTASISVAYAAFRNGMSLRCVITDSEGNKATSGEAILTYKSKLTITTQPENTTVNENEIAYFNVKASGNGLKFLWQYQEKGKSSWTDWNTKTTAAISVAYASYRNGMSLRCIITDNTGNKVTSNVATITYKSKNMLAITQQPLNANVNDGEMAYFEVTATGNGLKYLWQYKEAGKSSWTDWASKTTAKISVAYASYRNGMSLRCVVSDSTGNKVTSNTATLTYKVNDTLAITTQPKSASVSNNSIAYFSVKATGVGLKYQWQYKNAGDNSWTTWSSKTTADISVAYAAYRNGMSLRCIVTDSKGNIVVSDTATLSYK